MLEAQTKNIKDFCLAFVQFSRYIDIIDPQSVRDISIFIETKRNIVNVLTEEMKKQYGTHLFSPTLEDKLLDVASTDKVRALRNSRLAELKGDEEHIRYGFIPHHFRDGDYELYQHDIHRYFLQNLPKPEDEQINYYKMTENKIIFLKHYLETRRPLKQLEAMRPILKRLHEKLVSNFEVKDIIMQVGKEASYQDKYAAWDYWKKRERS